MALTSVSELQTLIHEHITRTPRLPEIEHIPVAQSIGRVLAEDMVSALNIPATDISAMDGYALPSDAAAGSCWQIVGESAAGKPFAGDLPKDGCIRIMTGAVVPPGSTCVVLQENTETEGNAIILTQDVAVGANIRYGGEEVATGDTVLTAGRILRPADVMLLAAIGIGQVPVYRKIKVAVLSTGDELNEPGTPVTNGTLGCHAGRSFGFGTSCRRFRRRAAYFGRSLTSG